MNNLQFIYPELVLFTAALIALMGGVFTRSRNFGGVVALLGIAAAAFLLPSSLQAGPGIFANMLTGDSFAVFFRWSILLVAAIVTLIAMGYREVDEADASEFYFFLLSVTVSMMLAVASKNLMMVYIAIEAISILSYIMAGYLKRDVFSSEAGVKYFLFGALSTGVMLYGISLVYGLFGTLDLNLILGAMQAGAVNSLAIFVSFSLILVGLGFKCSLAPFHMWTPDVYEGAPTPVSALFSVGPKAVGFALILRIFVLNIFPQWPALAIVIAIATMTIGNIIALSQTNIKRLLAYSTIAQAGYILVGLVVPSGAGIQATLFYIFVYILMNLGAFAGAVAIYNAIKSDNIADYAGYYKKDPFTAIALTISLLSLAGIPPLAGFLAKFFILAAAVQTGLITLAVIIAINSVIAFYYYIRIVKYMFFQQPTGSAVDASERSEQSVRSTKSSALQVALLVTMVASVVIGIWPHPIMNWLTSLLNLK